MFALETKLLKKGFDHLIAVDGISFSVESGTVFGLLGPNGAGKTTTIRMLLGLLKPDSGEAIVLGHDIYKDSRKIRSLSGFLPTNPGYYKYLTALEYLDYFAELHNVDKKKRYETIEKLLVTIGIWDRRNDKLSKYSTGMLQKINIVRALVHHPDILFLDEPTAGLDPEGVKIVRDYLLDIKAAFGRTIVLCTHNLPEAEKLCDSMAIIKKGKIMAKGLVDELKRDLFSIDKLRVRLKENAPKYRDIISKIEGVGDAILENHDTVIVSAKKQRNIDERIMRSVIDNKGTILEFHRIEYSLEDVYLELVRNKHEY